MGGVSVHSQARYTPIIHDKEKGHITKEQIEKKLNVSNDLHSAATTIISLENSLHGQIFPQKEILEIKNFSRQKNVRLHLDG